MSELAAWAADRDWQDIPLVKVTGVVMGILLIVAAIRFMFGKK
jgi:hypothetical protein